MAEFAEVQQLLAKVALMVFPTQCVSYPSSRGSLVPPLSGWPGSVLGIDGMLNVYVGSYYLLLTFFLNLIYLEHLSEPVGSIQLHDLKQLPSVLFYVCTRSAIASFSYMTSKMPCFSTYSDV